MLESAALRKRGRFAAHCVGRCRPHQRGHRRRLDHPGDGHLRARVGYAMARDGIFFKIVEGIHPKFRTPGRSLIFQGILASLMALTGTFEELTNLFIFAAWIFYASAVVALFRMRKTEPDLPRPYRCWGYPWVPGIFEIGRAHV